MVEAQLVVLIDANHEGEPGEVRIRQLSPGVQTSGQTSAAGAGTHATSPEDLVALTVGLYGHCPPVVLVALTGVDFDLGERLSSLVKERLVFVCQVVRQVCLHQWTSCKWF